MAQGTRPHTSPAPLKPQPKATRASVVSTSKRRLNWWVAQTVRGLRRLKTAMGHLPYPEKNADLPEFTLEHVHLLLRIHRY